MNLRGEIMVQQYLRWVRAVGSSLLLTLGAAWLLASCSGTTGPSCDNCNKLDGWCKKGVCDQVKGSCVAQPIDEGNSCDDGNACTLGETCQAGECVGTPMDCTGQDDECNQGGCSRGKCMVVPRPDGTPCASQTDSCHDGSCQAGSCTAVPKDNGTACNDGDWCTTDDACLGGTCAGLPRECSDNLDCTDDQCDRDRNACAHLTKAGSCLIAGRCFAEGDPNPANACQSCRSISNPADWTNDDGNSCDDGNRCTDPDQCHDGACSGTPVPGCCLVDLDCGDGKPCTTDACNQANGTCSNLVQDGSCLIGDSCLPDGQKNPANACQECRSGSSKTSWTNNTDACNDGLFCTSNDRCTNGACQGVTGVVCADALACTSDVCNEAGQVCSHPIQAGSCLIGNVCYPEGAQNPANGCQKCLAAANQTDWSNDDGAPCNDGNMCTGPDSCAGGRCTGTPIAGCCTVPADCDDHQSCTQDLCDVASGTCSNLVLPNRCYIAGSCYNSTDPNPNNLCQACAPGISPTSWSPANEGGKCGGICQACLGGSCRPLPDTGADPFFDCPVCRVCDGQGGCRITADGTDPKTECSPGECTNDSCQAGSCNKPAGTQCTDQSPTDCQDAQCDGSGGCAQNHASELPGTACDDSDPCTAPDLCGPAGLCVGSPMAPTPDANSPVAATSLCLTSGSGATSVVHVRLRSTSNQSISGATVTIEADNPAARWTGLVTESLAVPGTYFRVLLAPASAGSTSIAVTAASGSGACTSPVVALSGVVTIRFADPASSGTGSCSPIDSNLRVRVVAAESGAPIPGAYVMVGSSEVAAFESNFENVLAGLPPSLLNTARTDGNGAAEFTDHALALEGPMLVTTGMGGRSYVTLVQANASDIVVPLEAITGPPPSAKIDGTLTSMGNTNYDGQFDAGLVAPEFGINNLVKFRFDDLLASQRDCWLATDAAVVGPQWVAMPSNVYVPAQRERYLIIFDVPIYLHNYTSKPIPIGATNQHVVGISGRAPFSTLVDLLRNGGSLSDMVTLLSTRRIGLITRTVISGDEHNVPIDLNRALNTNVNCSISNKPAGADALCFTIGDWSGGTGAGPMFLMGFKVLSGGQGTMTTVANTGDFGGIGYLGAGVATFLNPDNLPVAEQWKANATSGILDRSGVSFNGSGGALNFNSFLEITPLSRSNRSFTWNSVATGTSVHYTEHTIDLVTSITYTPGPNCNPVTQDTWRSTYWKILTPNGNFAFTLPDLPAGWPRQVDGGLAAPAAGERLNWTFGAYFQGLLTTGFDYNRFDFPQALTQVTHSSTNNVNF